MNRENTINHPDALVAADIYGMQELISSIIDNLVSRLIPKTSMEVPLDINLQVKLQIATGNDRTEISTISYVVRLNADRQEYRILPDFNLPHIIVNHVAGSADKKCHLYLKLMDPSHTLQNDVVTASFVLQKASVAEKSAEIAPDRIQTFLVPVGSEVGLDNLFTVLNDLSVAVVNVANKLKNEGKVGYSEWVRFPISIYSFGDHELILSTAVRIRYIPNIKKPNLMFEKTEVLISTLIKYLNNTMGIDASVRSLLVNIDVG